MNIDRIRILLCDVKVANLILEAQLDVPRGIESPPRWDEVISQSSESTSELHECTLGDFTSACFGDSDLALSVIQELMRRRSLISRLNRKASDEALLAKALR